MEFVRPPRALGTCLGTRGQFLRFRMQTCPRRGRRRTQHPPPRPQSRELLSTAECPNGILQSLHVGEPQGCGRGIEASKLCRQRGDARAVTVCRPCHTGETRRRLSGPRRLYKHAKSNRAVADGDRGADRVRRRVDHRYGVGGEVGDIDLAAVGGYSYADGGEAADEDRGGHGIRRRVDHRYGAAEAVGDVNLAAVGAHRHAEGAALEGVASPGDDRVRRRIDHRYGGGEAERVGDVDLAAVGSYRHAEGPEANGDRGADRVRRRVDHRYGAQVRVRDIDLAAVGGYRYAEGCTDGDRGADHIRRRVDHRYGVRVREGVGDVDLAAVGAHRHGHVTDRATKWGWRRREANGDRGDDRIRRRVDHRYGVRGDVRDVDLAAGGAHRQWRGLEADGDRGDDRVGRRVDHRYGVGALVRDVGVLGACRRRTEQAGERQSESELFHASPFRQV